MNPTPHGPRLLLVAALACAVLPAAARAQDPPLVVDAQGDHAFRYLLKYAGLTPLNRIGDLNDVPPEETVVIIFGNLGCLQQLKQFPGGLRGFVNRGGALLIASDQPDNLELGAFGVVFNGTGVRMPVQVTDVNPPNALEPHKELTFGFGEPIVLSPQEWKRHQAEYYKERFIWIKNDVGKPPPLLEHCDKGIVTDLPSFITCEEGSEYVPLLLFPPFRYLKGPKEERKPAFAAAPFPWLKDRRALFLSSYSQFWNSAVVQQDTDNWRFMNNTVRWLTDNKKRKHALFIVDNKVVTNFNVPIGELPFPTRRMVNDLLRGLEEENFFNRLLDEELPWSKRIRAVAAVALIGLVLYGFRRYIGARLRQDFSVPLVEAKLAQVEADYVPPAARREQRALRANDFAEAARAVARECFDAAPGRRGADGPPRVVAGKAGARRGLELTVQALWQLAHAARVQPVPAEMFARIVQMAEQVKAAFAQGLLRWSYPKGQSAS